MSCSWSASEAPERMKAKCAEWTIGISGKGWSNPFDPPRKRDFPTPPLPRNPMNLLNPSDIASISILKDAAATAIYGARAANGVIHKNAASRKVSRLSARVRAISA